MAAQTLASLPEDVLDVVFSHALGHGDKALASLASTCSSLHRRLRTFREGESVFPVNLKAWSIDYHYIDPFVFENGDILLERSKARGHGLVRFAPVSSKYTTTWSFSIANFTGHRIEVGVATDRGFSHSGVNRQHSWSFDCFGHANIGGKASTYGRQMQKGDTLGVSFDPENGKLRFLDGGQSMGAIQVAKTGEQIFPYVYFGERAGEALVLKRVAGRGRIAKRLGDENAWMKPVGLPYDGRLIVTTWDHEVWYALEVCWETATLEDVWRVIAAKVKTEPAKVQLLYRGSHLVRNRTTLREAGIVLDEKSGTHSHDLQVSIPHLVS